MDNIDDVEFEKNKARAQTVFDELLHGVGSIVARERRIAGMSPVERLAYDNIQNDRAKAVIDGVLDLDSSQSLDYEAEIEKLNRIIANNLDAESIWAFAHIAGSTLRRAIFDPLDEVERNLEARGYAFKRHAPTAIAKQFVAKEWVKHRDSYGNNKSEFARHYRGRIFNEFKDAKGDPLDIKERTIRDLWLKDTPHASK